MKESNMEKEYQYSNTSHFLLSCFLLGFVNDSVTKSIVALRLTLVVKTSTCVPEDSHASGFECSGKGQCITKPSEVSGRLVAFKIHIYITYVENGERTSKFAEKVPQISGFSYILGCNI